MRKTFKSILFIFVAALIADFNYSLEDYNTSSPTYGLDVWNPEYSDYITIHYFSSQG
jgi:hypothetical protein